MFNGQYKLAKDICQGDFLMGVDSKPRRVDWVNRGYGPMYCIDQIRGDSYTVNGPHVLALRRSTIRYSKADRHLPKEKRRITHNSGDLELIEVEEFIKQTDAWKKQFKGFKKEQVLKTKQQIKEDILKFCGKNPEFWGYYCDYDWVLFCQIFGKMLDLPEHFPKFCLDIKQNMYQIGKEKKDLNIPKNELEHNALSDALEIKYMYDEVMKNAIIGYLNLDDEK
jgi:hypothetical protein